MVVFDTSKKGLDVICGAPWKSAVVEHLLTNERIFKTREIHEMLLGLYNETGNPEFKRSRAAVIGYLKELVDEAIVSFREETGKGGYHGIYMANMDLRAFWKACAQNVMTTAIVESGIRDLWQ